MAGNAREPATAIVLAGGKSSRMGADKSLLPLLGKPLIQHVCDQVAPHFDQVLIAGGDEARLAFLGLPMIADEIPGQGPLRAIATALAASGHDLNFVVACDTPRVNQPLLLNLLRNAANRDCVVPATSEGHHEPLFAVYRKTALPEMRRALDAGERRIVPVLNRLRTTLIPLAPGDEIVNINTIGDYRKLTLTLVPSEQQKCAMQKAAG